MSMTIRVVVCVMALAMLYGCRNDRRDEPRMTERELMNRSRLEPFPEPMRAAFLRDYPLATVTRVDTFTDASGRLLYQVNYVQNDRMQQAVYTSEGVRVEAPPQPVPATPPPAPSPPASPRGSR